MTAPLILPQNKPDSESLVIYNPKTCAARTSTRFLRYRAEAEAIDINRWLHKLRSIAPQKAKRVATCGTRGQVGFRRTADGSWRLSGGLCGDWKWCPTCSALHAEEEGRILSDVIHHLTANGVSPDRILFSTVTMNDRMGTTRERVSKAHAAMLGMFKTRAWKQLTAGHQYSWDHAGSILRPSKPWLHSHLHGIVVASEGVEPNEIRDAAFSYMRDHLGPKLIGWDRSETVWNRTFEPAALTPTIGAYGTGWAWRSSHEVTACDLKPSAEHPPLYRNFFDRAPADLAELHGVFDLGTMRTQIGGVMRLSRNLVRSFDAFADAHEGDFCELPPALLSALPIATRRSIRLRVRHAEPRALAALYDAALDGITPAGWAALAEDVLPALPLPKAA